MFSVVHPLRRLISGTRTGKWMLASAAAAAFAVPAAVQARPVDGDAHREVRQTREVRVERDVHVDRDEHRDLRDDHRDFRDEHRDFRDDHRDIRIDRDHDRRVDVDVRIGQPAFEERQVSVWVPAVYRTDCQQVWVPDQFEDRTVQYRDHGRLCTRVEHVLVVPGHYESRDVQVLVCDGHYETHIERVPVRTSPLAVINPALGGFDLHVGR